MSRSTPRAVASLLATFAVLLASACGGDGGTAPPKPASVENATTTPPTATVGTVLGTPVTFVVKDAGGSVIGNVPVSIVISGGGGTLAGAPTTSNSGATSVGTWTLGTTAGVNTLTVTIVGLTPLTLTATGTPGAMVKLVTSGGNTQTALAGASVATPLAVSAQDQFGNGIPGVQVTFQATAGGGSVTPSVVATNASGVATGVSWRLGNKGGTQSAIAQASGFTASFTANIQSSFPIDLRFFGTPMSTEAQSAFLNAANRLRAAIISPVTSFQIQNINLADCQQPGLTGTLNEITQGVIIYATVAPIDGPGKVLAQAGPCYLRGSSKLPFLGTMEFDEADIQSYITSGRFEAVVLHEMNHVLGLGTIWTTKSLLQNPVFDPNDQPTGSTNPRFTGSTSVVQCQTLGGLASHCTSAVGVAVEATGGVGTADGHWRESLFDSELMTGFAESTPNMPWSTMSIASFQDLGYSVNLLAADAYNVPSLLAFARMSAMAAESTHEGPWEHVRRPRFEVSSTGRVQRLQEKPQ